MLDVVTNIEDLTSMPELFALAINFTLDEHSVATHLQFPFVLETVWCR